MKTLLCAKLGCGAEIVFNASFCVHLSFYSFRLYPVQGFQALVDLIHYRFPDSSCIGSTIDTRHISWYIIANPDGSGVITGVAAEPGILAAVGSTGFSGCRHIVVQSQSLAGAVGSSKGSL